MKKCKGIIFDLDGVLVFTDKLHYLAWKRIADKLDIYFDERINNRLRGISRMDSLEIILENYHRNSLSKDDKMNLATEKNAYYVELLQNMTPNDIPDGVRQTLHALKEGGIKIALGSSSKNAKLILQQTQLLDYFDAISDGNNIEKAKPDPEVFLKAAQFLGISPNECLVVEDAEAGIDAAISGGMHPVAIGNATKCKKAEYNIENLTELLGICKVH